MTHLSADNITYRTKQNMPYTCLRYIYIYIYILYGWKADTVSSETRQIFPLCCRIVLSLLIISSYAHIMYEEGSCSGAEVALCAATEIYWLLRKVKLVRYSILDIRMSNVQNLTYLGSCLNLDSILPGMRISTVNIRGSCDGFSYIMGIPVLVKSNFIFYRHLDDKD